MKHTSVVSDQFARRFRSRMHKISKLGQPFAEDPEAVSEEVLRKVTLPPLPQVQHCKQNSDWPQAAKSKPAGLGPLEHRSNSSLSLTFEPYTLADYKLLRTPARLGGLGPSNMGSEEWCTAWRLRHKRLGYGLKAD